MSDKVDATQEQARAVVDRVAQELGLLVVETSGFIKVQAPANKHRVYVQRARTLNRIDTTIPIPADDPAYKGLSAPNGSISCHVTPDLEQLERALRMLGEASLSVQVPNKPRPFAATKAPVSRRPKPTSEPLAEELLEVVPEGGSLKDRLSKIHESARRARARRYMENHSLPEEEAYDVADGKVTLSEALDAVNNTAASDLTQVSLETGIDFS